MMTSILGIPISIWFAFAIVFLVLHLILYHFFKTEVEREEIIYFFKIVASFLIAVSGFYTYMVTTKADNIEDGVTLFAIAVCLNSIFDLIENVRNFNKVRKKVGNISEKLCHDNKEKK